MTAQPFDSGNRHLLRLHRAPRSPARPSGGYLLRQRLIVVAPSMVEAVRLSGGWLFDQVMAGWYVWVLTTDHTDSRPLRILGARPVDLECALKSPRRRPRPEAVAVHADVYRSDARIRRLVRESLGEGTTEVRLWGDQRPEDPAGAESVRHQLSTAARAFKAQALAAAAAPADLEEATEVFTRSKACR